MVTNASDEEWTDINVFPFIAQEPITTRDELAEAAETAPDTTVGDRLTDPGTYETVDELAPGDSAPFTLRMPVSSLLISGDPGVYWVGVHALGTSSDGRDANADGRARTFIPLVPPQVARKRTVPVSVVLPLRDRARRDADGSLNGPTRWVNLTRPDGRLTRLADFGASAGTAPSPGWSTWRCWTRSATSRTATRRCRSARPASGPGRGRRRRTATDPDGSDPSPEDGDSRGVQRGSLTESRAPHRPGLPGCRRRASGRGRCWRRSSPRRGRTPCSRWGTPTRTWPRWPAATQPAPQVRRPGRAADGGLGTQRQAGRGTAQRLLRPRPPHRDPPGLVHAPHRPGTAAEPGLSNLPSGQQLLMSDERAVTGGPAPIAARDPLALRQRVLSEAALEATKGDEPPRPVVLDIPATWNPGPHWREADFFGGLETSWLRIAPLPTSNTIPTYDGELAYGSEQRAKELGSVQRRRDPHPDAHERGARTTCSPTTTT